MHDAVMCMADSAVVRVQTGASEVHSDDQGMPEIGATNGDNHTDVVVVVPLELRPYVRDGDEQLNRKQCAFHSKAQRPF